MGRPRLSDAERERRRKETKAKWREKARGQKRAAQGKDHANVVRPKSWVKALTNKLDAVASDAGYEGAEAPPDRKGEPFADLPPLDISAPDAPPAPEGQEGVEGSASAESAGTTSNPSSENTSPTGAGKSESKTKSDIFDTKMLEAMASDMAEKGVMAMGEYAAARGFFALGEPFAKLAGIAAGVLVRVHATNVGISDEEAAAYVLGGILGVNGVQCVRAYQDEAKMKAESEKARFDDRRRQAEQARRATGIMPDEQTRTEPGASVVGEQPNVPRFSGGVV